MNNYSIQHTTFHASKYSWCRPNVLFNRHHVLKQLLPNETNHPYNLRGRRHNLTVSIKTDDRNFIIRQLFKDIY